MKKLILVITLFFSLNSLGQEMKYAYGKLFLDNVEITPKIAKEKSQFVSVEAFMNFQSAARIRGWNYFWGIFGGYELLAGSAAFAAGNEVAAIDMAIGGVCIAVIPSRESRRRLLMNEGVKAYNDALENEH